MPMTPQAGVRRRQIGDADLDAVAACLSRGFRFRPRSYWLRGFARLRDRSVPEGFPRYGYLLESDGRVVGLLLTIFSACGEEPDAIRCNLSSWYVEPAFRAHATLLLSYALKNRHVTYINISPAPNTWATIEAQGFRRYGAGKFLALPAFARGTGGSVRVGKVDGRVAEGLDGRDRAILADHARWGCLSLVVEAGTCVHPFVFASQRILHRLVPTMHLVYCRDIADFSRFAGPIGRYLLLRGMPSVLLDATSGQGALAGWEVERERGRFARGPNPPRPGDLAYTENVFFGH